MKIQKSDIESYVWDMDGRVRKYSGRGMYGKYCLGIVFSGVNDLIEFTKLLAEDVHNDVASEKVREFYNYSIERVSTDSMGYDTIFYWKNVELEGPDDDDEED